MHAPLSQQPSGQVVASQVGGAASQVRSLHTSPDAHVLHDAPPLPHADTAVPGMHFPSTSQQPEAQVEALHATPTQLWFWHCFPWPQATQGAPPVPHWTAVRPDMHMPALQQPAPQVAGVQVPGPA